MDDASAFHDGLTSLRGWRHRGNGVRILDDCVLIVPTFRRPAEVVRQLDALAGLPDVPGEVVIVDGSPEADTERAVEEWLRSADPAFDLLFVSSPPGLTRQRNVGVDLSCADLLFFLDDDCIPEPGYFSELRRVFRTPGNERVIAACGSIVNEMDRPLTRRWRLRIALGLIDRGTPGRYYATATSFPKSAASLFSGTREIDMVPGGAAAYRRVVFDRERFSLYFEGYAQGEDLEMSLRVRRLGSIVWAGDAHVRHLHAPGGRPPGFTHGRMSIRNRYFIWKRHSPDVSFRDSIRFWMDIGYGVLYDLASALIRPSETRRLGYFIGGVRGIAECWTNPPRYEEPAAGREYVLANERR